MLGLSGASRRGKVLVGVLVSSAGLMLAPFVFAILFFHAGN